MKEITLSKNFLDDVEQFANKELLKKNDITILLENYFKDRNIKEFEDFVFVGKYINGLFNVLQSANSISDFQNLEQVKKDLNDYVEKVISLLKEISLSADDKQKAAIKNNYLDPTKESFDNIKQLVEDLDLIKKYINFLKRK